MEIEGNAPAQSAAQTDSGEEVKEPQFVTSEELQHFGEKLAGDMKAMFGRVPHLVTEQMKSLTETNPAQKPEEESHGEVDPKAEVARLLKAEREALERDKKNINKQRVRAAIENSLVENGANPAVLKLVTDSLMTRAADKIKIEANELGETTVNYFDSEFAEAVSVGDFVKSFLSTNEGAAVVKPKVNPSVHGVPNGFSQAVGEQIKMTRAQAATADPKLLKSGRVVFVD